MDAPPFDTAARDALRRSYALGRTAIRAAQSDPRFSYALYVPPAFTAATRIVVCVHGSTRDSFLDFRDGFAEFGRWNDCIILCPLFPINVRGDGNANGYKYMQEGEIRYDLLLLSMVEEVRGRYGLTAGAFAIFGYSGGGHFSHRFAILHPGRLWACSIGAPGSVTLLDPGRDWWVGIRDLHHRFGMAFDAAALARVPVQMIVGDADLETWEITHKPGGTYWMEGANDAGRTRPDRLDALRHSFEAVGVTVRFDLLPGVSHDRMKVVGRVQDFFASVLRTMRG
ncbi:alpha/beta hydrolase [Roseomonas sp. CCTCC AB2023176]|uniref:alpha/beta hydrolase n=1 Tax=Roseomonas sp. CCTCC AB2023176 TaxID=3342640 RepID=UPI0035E375E7